MGKKPIIGITPLYDPERNNLWMLNEYMEYIESSGGIPMMLSLNTGEAELLQVMGLLDGILFPGGQDIDPALYGEEDISQCGCHVPQLDTLEVLLLHTARQHNKPVFGICRGLQLFNVALGGTLYQDIPTQMETASPILHNQRNRMPTDHPFHFVTVHKNTRLFDAIGKDHTRVNSLHHQGIKTLAPGLKAAAVAPDGLVECVQEQEGSFVLAVQWHPELMFHRDAGSRALMELFVQQCN